MRSIEFPLPKESSKTAEELEAEMHDQLFESDVQRAMRLAHFMHKNFVDITDYTNKDCEIYVKALREALGSDRLPDSVKLTGKKEAKPEAPETGGEVSETGGEVPEDVLGEAVRDAIAGAPAVGASREECDKFAAGLAAIKMKSMMGESNLGRLVKSVCPDVPDGDDEDACRKYLSDMAESAAQADELAEKLARYERMFSGIMRLEPEDAKTDPSIAEKFEKAWAMYLERVIDDVELTVRGSMKSE